MDHDKIREELIKERVIQNGAWSGVFSRLCNENLKNNIINRFVELTGNNPSSFSEAGYFVCNNMISYNKCYCGNVITNYKNFTYGYFGYCSVKCSKSDPKIINSTRITNLSRYGKMNVSQVESVKNKRTKTFIEKFGTEHYWQSDDAKKKSKQTCLERYGFEYASQSDVVRNKMENTTMERFGVKNIFTLCNSSHISPEAQATLSDKAALINLSNTTSVNSMAQTLGVCEQTIYLYLKQYGVKTYRSSYEKEIAAFLNDSKLKFVADVSYHVGKQLDFYIDEYKLGIEFNGLYWHSTKKLTDRKIKDPKNYHKDKYIACSNKGIRLLSINEDEWNDHKDAIKSKILNLCGKSEKGVGARKLKIRKIGKEASEFVDKHHIQGKTSGVIASYGAFQGEELVAVIQFNKQRGTGDIELIRFCSDGKTYAGLFSKMFKYAVNDEHYNEVISFADLRYSVGEVYSKNGFVEVYTIPPDYRYCKGGKTYHKSTFTKKRIAEKFDIDMYDLTEGQAMTDLGYFRIYDCGKIKYVWKRA